MRLSTAMMLGTTTFHLHPELYVCSDGGCLLGVAALAAGYHRAKQNPDNIAEIRRMWPWVTQEFEVPHLLKTIECSRFHLFGHAHRPVGFYKAESIIGCMAFHVKDGSLSVEQVVDWVRSVEPDEPDTPETVKPEVETVPVYV